METITPLSKAIGVKIDTSIGRDDVTALAKSVAALPSDATVLICWEHDVLTEIAQELGVANAPKYGSSEYDLQWKVQNGQLKSEHENC